MKIKTFNIVVLVISIAIAIVSTGCSFQMGANGNTSNAVANSTNKPAETANVANNTPAKAESAVKLNCTGFTMPGMTFIAKQSFPFDHNPYHGSCFVTFASKDDMLDQKDVPRGSKFFIFRDGKKIFEFPDAFGGQSACWVEAVSFEDLNADGDVDVIVAGSCLGAKDSYPTNAIYRNIGRGFTTNDESNTKLEEFKTIKEIEAFAKKNLKDFF